MNSSRLILLLVATFSYLISTATVSGSCYNYNGTDRNNGAWDVGQGNIDYLPCNNVASFSMCCRLNYGADSCMANGLCAQGGSSNIWRESCSDSSWKSSSCLKLCVSDNVGDMEVLQCPDQSWCCEGGANNLNATNCCEKGKGSWIVNGQVTGVNPNSTSTSSSSSTSSATKTAAPTRSTQSSSEIAAAATGTKSPAPQNTVVASSGGGGSHTGAIVGGIVGGVAALLLIAGASWFLVRRRSSHAQPLVQPMGSYHGAPPGMPEKDGVSHQYRAEMGAQKPGLEGHELEAEPVNRELDGATRSELGGLGAKR